MSASAGMPSNPFEVLGLDRSATFEDVKIAFLRLSRQYHPDANPGNPAAVEQYATIRRAYDRLKLFYQTIDDSGSIEQKAPTRERPGTGVPLAARRGTGTPLAAPRGTGTTGTTGATTRGTGGTGQPENREHVPEPTVTGTGNRRAFYRTGGIRQSGEIAARGATGQRGGHPAGARLPAPQSFGSGHVAARADLVRSHNSAPPGDTPWMFYALVGLHASDETVFPRIPLNLCLVLDHSSSMLRGGKVDRLKETVRGIIDQLDEEDYLSIVTFGDRAEVLLPAQLLRNKAMIYGAIDAMRCRGGTEIARGLAAGLSELSRNTSRALSHLILLTDGQTRGDEMACLERAEEAANLNVGVTAYGLGTDWNNVLLDGIAAPSGGHSDFIESPEEMARAFSQRVHSLQSTTLHKMTLAVRPVEGYALRRATLVNPVLRPLDAVDKAGAQTLALGDLGDSEYRVLLEFVLGPRYAGTAAVATLTLSYDVPGLQRDDEALTIPITVPVSLDHNAQDPVDPRVAEAMRHITAHRLQQQAWTEMTKGNVGKGTGLLKTAAEHLDASGHADLARITADEAARIEAGQHASDENIKRIIYGTRKLG